MRRFHVFPALELGLQLPLAHCLLVDSFVDESVLAVIVDEQLEVPIRRGFLCFFISQLVAFVAAVWLVPHVIM